MTETTYNFPPPGCFQDGAWLAFFHSSMFQRRRPHYSNGLPVRLETFRLWVE